MHFTDEGDVGNAACEALECSVLSFLQCQRHALDVETISFELVTLKLLSGCVFEELPCYISNSARFRGERKGLLTAKERLKFTKSYSSASFSVCYSCHKPEHAPDKMDTVEKENTEWMFLKNWAISVWKILRANVICITIMSITQKDIFLVVSVSTCC